MSTKSAFSVLVHFLIIGKNLGRKKRPYTPLNIFFVFDCKPSSRVTKVACRAKTHIFAPKRYTVVILYTNSLNSA